MAQTSGPDLIEQTAKRLREPAWVTDLRRKALARHAQLPWPHPSDDVWRRTDVSLLDPAKGFAPAAGSLRQAIRLSEAQAAAFTQPLGGEALLVRANGSWLTEERPSGLTIADLAQAAEAARPILGADGFTPAEQKLASLNEAFHHDDVLVDVPGGWQADRPVRLVHLWSVAAQEALYPLTVIRVGAGSVLTLLDEYVSLGAPDVAHLINARIELVLEPNAAVHYVRLQRWGTAGREFLLQRATLGRGAKLTMANLTLGAALSKAHLVTRFAEPEASSQLYGFVFGHGRQHVDQHTLQDHQAPRTTSDLQFRAALQDESRMVYTGLIRIAKAAKQTNAYQANHNLLLSRTAKAETIPMLEISADDVQCKHGASVGPIDEEQAFYLMSRGLPREQAERLIVMGFVEPMIQQVPFEPLQERLRQEIEGGIRQEAGR
jgi:Fe-S cluster assembly protein SufD